jgi:hypothetical protein
MLCLFVKTSQAQFFQDFESSASLSSNCWSFVNFSSTTVPSEVISGSASLYSNPPTSGSSTRDVYTPYLNITSNPFTVSFKYKLNSNLSGQAQRTIEVGLMDVNGIFTSLRTITITQSTNNQNIAALFTRTFSLSTLGVRRLVLRFGGSQGDGNTRMIIDELSASASPYYGPSSNCNTAPVAGNNTYSAPLNGVAYTAPVSVLNNDSDPNGEALTATLATQSLDGTVVMSPDGTFTFTPNAGFTGSFTTFTYTVSDNGYSSLSTTATVNIYFTVFSTLPLTLLDFSGTMGSNKITLNWNVSSNETGAFFEIQRSSNGSAWQPIAMLFTSEQSGMEQYHYANAAPQQTVQYRLKLVNKDGTFSYSNVLSFTTAAFDQSLTLLQNPVQATLRFTVPVSVTRINGITIYSANGIKISTAKTKFDKNNNTISMALPANLPTGTYILQVLTDAGSKTATFIKQ